MFGIRSWHFLALSCHLASKIQSQNQNARKGHQIISNSHVRPLASALHIGILKWIRLRRPHIPGANARETVQEKLRKLDKAMTRQRSWNWERLESLKSKSLDLGWSWTFREYGTLETTWQLDAVVGCRQWFIKYMTKCCFIDFFDFSIRLRTRWSQLSFLHFFEHCGEYKIDMINRFCD